MRTVPQPAPPLLRLSIVLILLSEGCTPASEPRRDLDSFSDPQVSIPNPALAPDVKIAGLSEGAQDVAVLRLQPSLAPHKFIQILLKLGYTITRQGEVVYKPDSARDSGLRVNVIQVALLLRSLERPMEFQLKETLEHALSVFPGGASPPTLFHDIKGAYLRGLSSSDRKEAYAAEVFLALGAHTTEGWDVGTFEMADEISVSYLQYFLLSTRFAAETVALERRQANGSTSAPLEGSFIDCSPPGAQGVVMEGALIVQNSFSAVLTNMMEKYGFGKASKLLPYANVLLSFLELGLSQWYIDLQFGYENASELVRTRGTGADGETQGLLGVVQMKGVENLQWLKCARFALGRYGVELDVPDDGPISQVPATFELLEGGDDTTGFVWLSQLTPRTNDLGEARATLVGRKQAEDLGPNPKQVQRSVLVRMSAAAKAMDFAKDIMKIASGGVQTALGDPSGAIAALPDIWMRTRYFIAVDRTLPVKDWEKSRAPGWSGTSRTETHYRRDWLEGDTAHWEQFDRVISATLESEGNMEAEDEGDSSGWVFQGRAHLTTYRQLSGSRTKEGVVQETVCEVPATSVDANGSLAVIELPGVPRYYTLGLSAVFIGTISCSNGVQMEFPVTWLVPYPYPLSQGCTGLSEFGSVAAPPPGWPPGMPLPRAVGFPLSTSLPMTNRIEGEVTCFVGTKAEETSRWTFTRPVP
jgi:hypothetical protein